MSRLSQIFHNQSSTNAEDKGEHTQAPNSSLEGLIDNASAGLNAADTNFLDQLKPKIKEVLQEIKDEEQKLCTTLERIDPNSLLHKIPILPRFAQNLPDPVKSRVKTLLGKLCKQQTGKPIYHTGSETAAKQTSVTEAASKIVSEGNPSVSVAEPAPSVAEIHNQHD